MNSVENVLEVKELSKFFDLESVSLKKIIKRKLSKSSEEDARFKNKKFWALKDVSFNLKKGDRLGILGKNGAGKSTLLKIISRILYPNSGEIRIRGRLNALLELGAGFHEKMTGRQNVFLQALLLGLDKEIVSKRLEEIIQFSGLEHFIDLPIRHYSSGMKTRLAFAIASFLDPDILVLDEVLAVGDIAFQEKCLKRIDGLKEENRSIILVSHSMGEISKYCNRVIWIDSGEIKYDGEVLEGIQRYQESMGFTSKHNDLNAWSGTRTGTGFFRYTSIKFLGVDGNSISSIKSGDSFIIELEFEEKTQINSPVEDIELNVIIENDKGQRVTSFLTSVVEKKYDVRSGVRKAKCVVQNLPLLPGIYPLTISLLVNRQLSDKVVSCINLFVEDSNFYGTSKLPIKTMGDWCAQYQWR